MMKTIRSMKSAAGFTLVELLMTMIISSIAFMALVVPFVAERTFWATGRRETAAQRDAHMAVHTISRAARESSAANVTTLSAGHLRLTLARPCGTASFEGGPAFNGGQLVLTDGCESPAVTSVMIDGAGSRLLGFDASGSGTDTLWVRLNVTNENEGSKIIETKVFLRNA